VSILTLHIIDKVISKSQLQKATNFYYRLFITAASAAHPAL